MAKLPIKRPSSDLTKKSGKDLIRRPGSDLSKRAGSDLTKQAGSAPVVVVPERLLTVFDQALPKSVVDALTFGNHQRVRQIASRATYAVGPAGVGIAKQIRERHIWALESADQSNRVLQHVLSAKLERATAAEMIATMLDGYRSKGNEGPLAAMLDLLESDDIARVFAAIESERASMRDFRQKADEPLWRPIGATPAAVALACRKLIATTRGYPAPQACELGTAVRTAQNQLRCTQETCQTVVESLQIADAVMLEFAPREEWFKPWRPSPYRPPTALVRMLRLHEQYGDAREQIPGEACLKGLDGNYYEDEDGNEVNGLTAFGELVKREQVDFKELMGPVEFKRITDQIKAEDKGEQPPAPPPKRIAEQIATETIEQLQAPAQPKRIAAARKRSEIKRRIKRRGGRKRKAHKEEPPQGRSQDLEERQETHARERVLVNRDGLTESEFDERLGWGGYGIENGVCRNFSEDDGDGGNI